MDGNQPNGKAHKDSLGDWPDKERQAPKKPEHLPPSSDKEFWGEDAEVNTIDRNKLVTPDMSKHHLEWQGPYAVCVSCPFRHAVPLDFKKYNLIDGKPVPKTTP